MKKRGNDNADVPISSLIDVVFLLIMFFVVTSNIEKEAHDVKLELVKTQNMKPVTKAPPKRVTINIQNEEDGNTVYIGNFPVPVENLQATLIRIKNEQGDATVVMIRADRDVVYKVESEVIEAIKGSGLSKIRIQAELGEEK